MRLDKPVCADDKRVDMVLNRDFECAMEVCFSSHIKKLSLEP
jgi:hypothetical protein